MYRTAIKVLEDGLFIKESMRKGNDGENSLQYKRKFKVNTRITKFNKSLI